MPPLAPPCQCSLQLSDPRKIIKYREALHEQLTYHNVLDKCQDLSDAATNKKWLPSHQSLYEQLDKTITQAMLLAEQKVQHTIYEALQVVPSTH
jgi:hypothetical protein